MSDVMVAVGAGSGAPPPRTDEAYERLRGRLVHLTDSMTLAELLASDVDAQAAVVLAPETSIRRTRSPRSTPAR